MVISQDNNTGPGRGPGPGLNMDNNNNSLTSSLVWIILFSLLIILSVISNTAHLLSSLARRQFSLPQLVLFSFFLVNLLDYALLVFDFSLAEENHFPYSEHACAVYQLLHHCSPLLTATALLTFSRLTLTCPALNRQTTNNKTERNKKIFLSLVVAATLILLLLPSLIFSQIAVFPSTARYCVIDLSGLASRVGLDITSQHILTAIYFILYKSVLPYWVPLSLIVLPVVKMMKKINFSDDKYFSQSLNLTIVTSFFVFNLPLALLEVTRQAMIYLSPHQQAWTIQVLQSLFLLLSFFYHIFRPVACLVLNSSEIVKIGGYQHVQTAGESA